jgi:predicted HTH transcriptional regulator
VDVCLYRRATDQNEASTGNVIYSDHDDAVLLYLREIDNQISTRKASEVLKISDRRTRTILKSLVERNILIRIDNGPQTHYILSGKQGVTRMPAGSG